jgi:transcriptional regulator
MSKILRRPMFRGGPVSSYGTGIASGLGYNTGGRVGYSNGGTGLDFLKKAFLGKRFTDPNYQPPQLFPKNVSSFNIGNFGQSPADLASALSEGSAYAEYLKKPEDEFETITTDSGDVKLKLDEKGNPIKKEEPNLTLAEQIEKQRIEEITAKDPQGADLGMFKRESEVLPGTNITQERAGEKKIKKTLASIKSGDLNGKEKPEKEESVEYTVEDYIKMLGGDKARRRDLGDMLGRASAAFLGTGDVKEGLAQFMAAEAAAGPSRREKIEQAAATLDIKDKIASKRSKENIDLMKEKVLFELGAKSAALKDAANIKSMNAGDGLTYIAKEIYKGSKDRSSSRVLKTFIDIKLDTDANIRNVGDLNTFEIDELPEGVTIVSSNQGKRVYFKKGNDVKPIDINQL